MLCVAMITIIGLLPSISGQSGCTDPKLHPGLDESMFYVEPGRILENGMYPEHTAVGMFCPYRIVTFCTNGNWDPPLNCTESCKYPHVPYGTGEPSKQGYTVGDIVTYECREGYNLDGPTTATCQGGNKWTPLPECNPV